jgi:predicted small lipoprotein YifL
MIVRYSALTLAALAALTLAGCGKEGELERPAPLWGHAVVPNTQTHDRQAAEAAAKRDAKGTAGRQAPQSSDEVRVEDAQLPPPPPLAGTPLVGAPPPPNPAPPPGGLPDPMHPASVPQ